MGEGRGLGAGSGAWAETWARAEVGRDGGKFAGVLILDLGSRLVQRLRLGLRLRSGCYKDESRGLGWTRRRTGSGCADGRDGHG